MITRVLLLYLFCRIGHVLLSIVPCQKLANEVGVQMQARLLSQDAEADLTPFNHRLQFIWEAGTFDLGAGLETSALLYYDDLEKSTSGETTVHILLFVIMFICLGALNIYLMKPFLKRTVYESQRVAELLSQLPGELNVEGLIEKATGKKREESLPAIGGKPEASRKSIAVFGPNTGALPQSLRPSADIKASARPPNKKRTSFQVPRASFFGTSSTSGAPRASFFGAASAPRSSVLFGNSSSTPARGSAYYPSNSIAPEGDEVDS